MKFPWLATAFVAAAMLAMAGLGVWQLQRAAAKKDLLARFEKAQDLPEVAWPATPREPEAYYFRRASGLCLEVAGWRATAGRNLKGETGWSHIAACRTGVEGPGMQVDMGWSKRSDPPAWRGGPVSGVIAPDSQHLMRLVSANAAPGLQPSAPPSIDSIPNNHTAYAFQWFLFAGMAGVIYVLALRKRRRDAANASRQDGGKT